MQQGTTHLICPGVQGSQNEIIPTIGYSGSETPHTCVCVYLSIHQKL